MIQLYLLVTLNSYMIKTYGLSCALNRSQTKHKNRNNTNFLPPMMNIGKLKGFLSSTLEEKYKIKLMG